MKIGWFSNWFTFDYLRDSGVPKNIREIPIIKELTKYGKMVWLGAQKDPSGIADVKAENFGGVFNGLPKYDKKIWGSTAKYVHDVAVNYEKYAKRSLPNVDCVFLRVLPSFIYENAKIYILLYQYGLRGIPVFARDLELLMVKRFIVTSADFEFGQRIGVEAKPFGISGSDKAFSMDEWWTVMARNLYILAPFSLNGRIWLQKRAPHLKFVSFHFPYDENLYPKMDPQKPFRAVTYIGNDTGRRHGFGKYFSGLPEGFVHVYGGQARQVNKAQKGFPETFRARFPNIVWHGPINHSEVNRIYNRSATCMNIPRPYFNGVGFLSARFLEAVFSGAVLLLPKEFRSASFYTGSDDLVVASSDDVREIALSIKKNLDTRISYLEKQRSIIKSVCNVEKNVGRVMEELK